MNHIYWISQKICDFCDYLGGVYLKNKAGYLTNAIVLKLSSYGLLQRVGYMLIPLLQTDALRQSSGWVD